MYNGLLTRDLNFFKNTICVYKDNLTKKSFSHIRKVNSLQKQLLTATSE
jgi:hypothetical protein